MGELRRRGEAVTGEGSNTFVKSHDDTINELKERLLGHKEQGPKPGMSNEAKAAKDELAKDPYNMENIYALGCAYGDELHWEKCCNVLLRGWKRIHESSDLDFRFDFLSKLCEASCKLEKYRQALAVFNDIEKPDAVEDVRAYYILECQVFGYNKDFQRTLDAFHNAINGADFGTALGIWAACLKSLKLGGPAVSARCTMDKLAVSDEERQKIESIENLVEMGGGFRYGHQEDEELVVLRRRFTIVAVVVASVIIILMLYWLETRNLDRLKIARK
uniref:Uncharacterized protein n=1 Tax=Noctiluca scintillans TaxID=2966 RepID=A0A7S1F7Z6_NOCSC|mmetsp:Transcript_41900/g.110977  ORF Transcript_41900/g.110977 Transcript_41900/m.110977 type:complete len:275 (+) Transcript_41900:59-883(+)